MHFNAFYVNKQKGEGKMKFCTKCGAEMHDEAVVCVKCGCSAADITKPVTAQTNGGDDTLTMIVKIFLIIGCIAQGWMIVPLAWCLPITLSIFKCFKENRPVGTGLKVCALLFVNMIAGICMLCMKDND